MRRGRGRGRERGREREVFLGVVGHMLKEGRLKFGGAKIDGMGEIIMKNKIGKSEKEKAGNVFKPLGAGRDVVAASLTVPQHWEKLYMGEFFEIWDLWTA